MKTCAYPPVLPVLSGIFTESFGMDPQTISRHAKGLIHAGAMDPEYISARSSTALLLACLNTDPFNATGAFHLPLSGVVRMDYDFREYLAPDDASLNYADLTFGDYVAHLVHLTRMQAILEGYLREVFISGKNQFLRAGVSTEQDGQHEVWWYGHQPIEKITALPEKSSAQIHQSQAISGSVLNVIADFLNGKAPTLHSMTFRDVFPSAVVH